jgi:RND family efflux transporter MFP subunit
MKSYSTFAVNAGFVLACLVLPGCARGPAQTPEAPPTVSVSHPVERQVTDYADYTGRIAATDTVDVRARVWGYLEKVDFKEGQLVKKGAVLYEIDPRTYQALYEAKKAEVAQNEASIALAKVTYERFKSLAKKEPGAVSQQELDKYKAQEDQAVANLDLARANLKTAKLNLDWTKVEAPISGRVSRTLVTTGNLVQSAEQPTVTLLTTIVSLDPIWAYFDVDERTVQQVRQMIREGKFKSARDVDWPVFIGLANDEGFPQKGIIDFVDNQVNPRTGTLKLRAVFANPREILSPGFFVRVRMPIGFPHPALLVSDRAIDTDQGQKIVYVIDKENKVTVRPIRTGALHDGMRVIAEGLKAGEQVVVNGLQQIRPEMVVAPKLVEMPRSGVATQVSATEK